MNTNDFGEAAKTESPELTQSEIDAGVALLRGWLDELDTWFAKDPEKQTLNLECPVPVQKLNAVVCNLAFSITKRRANVSAPWFRAVERKWPS